MATASKGPPPVKQLPPEICTVAFDSLGTSEAELKSNVVQMVESVGGLALLKKSPADIAAFMDSVQAKMKANPYHNFSHICDVTQFMYTALVQTKIAERLSPLQRTALVLAAICHDLEHPGLSNVYQVNEKTEYAVRYNNESPLENHHLEVARALVTQHQLLAALSGPEVDEFWTLVRQCILGTDMAKHGTMTKELDEFLGAEGADPLANARVLQLGLSILLKCADISNQARPFSVSQTWNDVVYQEFYHEGDLDAKARARGQPAVQPRDERHLQVDDRVHHVRRRAALPALRQVPRAHPALRRPHIDRAAQPVPSVCARARRPPSRKNSLRLTLRSRRRFGARRNLESNKKAHQQIVDQMPKDG